MASGNLGQSESREGMTALHQFIARLWREYVTHSWILEQVQL
jgi:hypothetical protein